MRSSDDTLWKRSSGKRAGKNWGIFAGNGAFRCFNEHPVFADLL